MTQFPRYTIEGWMKGWASENEAVRRGGGAGMRLCGKDISGYAYHVTGASLICGMAHRTIARPYMVNYSHWFKVCVRVISSVGMPPVDAASSVSQERLWKI